MKAQRNDALINGAIIALGTFAVFDITIFHWLMGLHRIVSGPSAIWIEAALVVLGVILMIAGIWREIRARRV